MVSLSKNMDLSMDLSANYGAEVRSLHTRLMRVPLAIEESYSYWQNCHPNVLNLDVDRDRITNKTDIINQLAEIAFEKRWFGSKSMARTQLLLKEFSQRYDAYPVALLVLQQWQPRDLLTRRNLCHWHLQLVDPLYRAFTDHYLGQRRILRADITDSNIDRDIVGRWVSQIMGRDHWSPATIARMATGLIAAAASAGLCSDKMGKRNLLYPQVSDLAVEYWLYFLRALTFEGTLLDNPYWRSVGLTGSLLETRLQRLPNLDFRRMGELIDFGWQCADLKDWALRLDRENMG